MKCSTNPLTGANGALFSNKATYPLESPILNIYTFDDLYHAFCSCIGVVLYLINFYPNIVFLL